MKPGQRRLRTDHVIYPEESYAIIGACFSVYNEKGCGFVEPVYQECLESELEFQGVPFDPHRELRLEYRGRTLKQKYIPDFVCYDKIIVELKAVSQLTDEHRAQVFNYLRATGMKLGLLVNFGRYPDLRHERIVLTESPRGQQRP
jgi:GxxExxY protein